MDDAKSKLLLVPTEGNETAEKAAKDLNVPIATLALSKSGGTNLVIAVYLLLQPIDAWPRRGHLYITSNLGIYARHARREHVNVLQAGIAIA